jgi:DNA helicase-2/ATP-dependent DNA helicase PcrA
MARDGLLDTKLYFSKSLDGLLGAWRGSAFGFNFSSKVGLLRTIADRRHNDLIDMAMFPKMGPIVERKGRDRIEKALAAYDAAVSDAGVLDFAQLERRLADGLKVGAYASFTKELKAILVDEYQDTNLLQETIYILLAKASGAPLSVVGDDDQSLYRFRGATVELFRDFPERLKRALARTPKAVFLTRNYRSTKSIVDFVASYGRLDPKFQQVRVADKPSIQAYPGAQEGMPVLAMFRKDIDTLADDLSGLIHRVFCGNGFPVAGDKILKGNGGGVGDAALLCFSPAEDKGDRLPGKLRSRLGSLKPSIQLFNPRGEDLAEISSVQEFGGLLLECLDPKDDITQGLKISYEAKDVFAQWRTCARQRLKSTGGDLRKYVNGWRNCDPGRGQKWPREVPAIDLVYALRHWFPEFQNDPEQQVYLETFTRQLQAAEEVSPFGGRAVWDTNKPHLHQRSIEHLLRNFLAPIADGSVGVNEELIETFPRDRFSVISIHQSKGLEFPLVIVDVGSRFKTDHHSQARFRFPTAGDLPHTLEDKMRPASSLKAPSRSAKDRAFDDLYRLYYVAFSRARDVLLLAGLESDVPNVARGWERTCSNAWSHNAPWTLIESGK